MWGILVGPRRNPWVRLILLCSLVGISAILLLISYVASLVGRRYDPILGIGAGMLLASSFGLAIAFFMQTLRQQLGNKAQ